MRFMFLDFRVMSQLLAVPSLVAMAMQTDKGQETTEELSFQNLQTASF